MRVYERDDEVTFYFVVYDDGINQRVQAWTDKKEYAKAYMEFHKCKYHHLKTMNGTYDKVIAVINENANDEIQLYNLTVKNPKHKKGQETKTIAAPMTQTEATFINEEVATFFSSRINYSYVNGAFHYLRTKYQKALKGVFFEDIMNNVVLQKRSPITECLQMDELMVLFRSFPDHFGQ